METVSPSSISLMPANQAPVAQSARALLVRLIDYAGLFPPASLSMEPAVANYDTYARSGHAWMLGRFIVPVARLPEFEEAMNTMRNTGAKQDSHWGLSALPGADVGPDLLLIRDFNARLAASQKNVKVESIEVKIANAQEIDRLAKIIPAQLETYFEIPLTADLGDCITAVAACGRRAKIRTGGETADKFPAPDRVVEFMRLCAASSVAFKATAGLHHPLRSCHPLTYQPDSPSGIMHGFLNVFLAAAFLRTGMDAQPAIELLNEQSAAAFHFDADGVAWREHGWASTTSPRRARTSRFPLGRARLPNRSKTCGRSACFRISTPYETRSGRDSRSFRAKLGRLGERCRHRFSLTKFAVRSISAAWARRCKAPARRLVLRLATAFSIWPALRRTVY